MHQRIPRAANEEGQGIQGAPIIPLSHVVSANLEMVPKTLPQSHVVAVQPVVTAHVPSPAMKTNALLQQVISLLTAQKVPPCQPPNAHITTPLTVASNARVSAPNTTKQGASGDIDCVKQLEERLGAIEK